MTYFNQKIRFNMAVQEFAVHILCSNTVFNDLSAHYTDQVNWHELSESNTSHQFWRLRHNHYTKPAQWVGIYDSNV